VLGWQKGVDEADGGEVLLLPSATQMTMANVRTIDAAIERQAEAAKVKARSEAAARARATDPQREAIRAQMEADRRERAARGPITQGSVAVAKGEFGPRGAATINGPLPGAGGAAGGAHGHGAVRCCHDAAGFRAILDEGRASGKPVIVDFTASWCVCGARGIGSSSAAHRLRSNGVRLAQPDSLTPASHRCGPCKMMAPVFEELANATPGCIFVKVDVDEASDVSGEAGVRAMPTFMKYKNGAKADEFSGADPAKLKAMVASA
jgi:thioredoxin 1